MESNFREEIKQLIAPYLREIDNVDYLALKIEYIHNKYIIKKRRYHARFLFCCHTIVFIC